MEQTIHVYLLNEGTDAWRPVQAALVGAGRYRILGDVPDSEVWQFQPGDIVRCRQHVFSDGRSGLVAAERIVPHA